MRWFDWLLVLAGCGFVLAGPVLALQELAGAEVPSEEQTYAYRVSWRGPLLAGVVFVGVMGTLVAFRVLAQKRVRQVTGRLVGLLLAGMSLLDVAWLLDGWLLAAPPMGRASTVVWIYTAGGLLVVGSALRLFEVEAAFLPRREAWS